jgi:hypothetical protein
VEERIRFQKIVNKCGERDLEMETSNGISKLKSVLEIFKMLLELSLEVQVQRISVLKF